MSAREPSAARVATDEDLVKLAQRYPAEMSSLPQLATIEGELRRRGYRHMSDHARTVRHIMESIEDGIAGREAVKR